MVMMRDKARAALLLGVIVTAGSAPSPTTLIAPNPAGVTGTVRFSGTPPPARPIDMTGDDYCLGEHSGIPPSVEPVRVGGGGLADVVVYVKEGMGPRTLEAPEGEVVLDQRGCMYRPRVLVLQTGQTLVIRNSDATLHNVHAFASINRGFNIGQPLRGLESRKSFDLPEVPVPIECDIHGWMTANVLVLGHPFFAITGADGAFSLDGLPPGEYVLEAWHETLGTRTQTVTVTEGRPTTVDFTFEG